MDKKIVCPWCGKDRVYAIRRNKFRCANSNCKKEWKATELPLQLSRGQWERILELFLRERPLSAKCIAKKTNIERKRVLRALFKTRIAIKNRIEFELLGHCRVWDARGDKHIKINIALEDYLSNFEKGRKKRTDVGRNSGNYRAEYIWRYTHHLLPLKRKVKSVIGLISLEYYKNSRNAAGNRYYDMGAVQTIEKEDKETTIDSKQPAGPKSNAHKIKHFPIKSRSDTKKMSIPKTFFQQGVTYFKERKHAEAIGAFDKAIEQERESRSYFFRGRSFLLLGQYGKAISDFNRAIELDKKNATAYCMRAIAYAQIKDYDKTIPDLREAMELSVNANSSELSHYNQIQSQIKQKKSAEYALGLDPKYIVSQEHLTTSVSMLTKWVQEFE